MTKKPEATPTEMKNTFKDENDQKSANPDENVISSLESSQ